MRKKLLVSFSFLLSSCTPPSQIPTWNIKEIKTEKYLERIQRSDVHQQMVDSLKRHHSNIAVLAQMSNENPGSLSGIYADGNYFDFSEPETTQKLVGREIQLIQDSFGPKISNSRLMLNSCIDLTHSTTRSDAGTIKASLFYQLSSYASVQPALRTESVDSCLPAEQGKPLYRQSTVIQASFDGSRLRYQVVNPSKPLLEIERFDLVLSDLLYQATESILTDPELATAIDNALMAEQKSTDGKEAETSKLCSQLKLKQGSEAFKECNLRFPAEETPH